MPAPAKKARMARRKSKILIVHSFWLSNAGRQARRAAGARHERTLAAVACPGRIGDYSTNPPTEPYVKISLIRFLGTARFHTARLPDIADNPRHLSPSALQHN